MEGPKEKKNLYICLSNKGIHLNTLKLQKDPTKIISFKIPNKYYTAHSIQSHANLLTLDAKFYSINLTPLSYKSLFWQSIA